MGSVLMQMYVVLVRSFGLVNKYWPLWWCLDLSITYLCPNYFSGTRLATFMRKLHQIYQMLWDDTVYRWPFIIESMFFFFKLWFTKGSTVSIDCHVRGMPSSRTALASSSIYRTAFLLPFKQPWKLGDVNVSYQDMFNCLDTKIAGLGRVVPCK